MSLLDIALEEELAAWRAEGLERVLRTVSGLGPRLMLDGRPVLSLAGNDYLGMASHPGVVEAALSAAEAVGVGAGSSPLVAGRSSYHAALEQEIASWCGTSGAVLFDSGYAANTGVIPALAGRGDLVLSDALNHASLVDGCRLSRATIRIYPHTDLAALEQQLQDRGQFRRCLLVTDSVFSMDGDLAPLPALCDLAEHHDAALVVDDAHAVGLLGPTGSGAASLPGAAGRVAVRIGTLSKAVGCSGGFVAGSAALTRFLVNRARTFVFSTALPPAVAAAALASIRIIRTDAARRQRALHNARVLAELFTRVGLAPLPAATTILPVPVGDEFNAAALSTRLLEAGIFIPSIRYPTVARGAARLRVTASAALTDQDLTRVAEALQVAVSA